MRDMTWRVLAAGAASVIGAMASGDDVVNQPIAHVPGEVIVRFEQVPTPQVLAALATDHAVTQWRTISHAPHPLHDPDAAHPLAFVRVATVADADVAAASDAIADAAGVAYAHPNYLMQAAFEPNDPAYNVSQYGPQIIDAPGAWDSTLGSASIVVAVCDTGINHSHEDFQEGAIWINEGEIPDNGIDDDANGYIDDVNGWDTLNDDKTNTDGGGHGSHVAGTVGARLNNGIGMAGMANVTLMPIQVFSAGGGGTFEAIAEAVFYATDNGAKVINYSGGGGAGSGLLLEASEYAWDNDVTFVAAAGNGNSPAPHYPAYYPTVLAISGTDSNDQRYTSSNYGEWIDVAAPGVGVYSCWWNGAQAYNSITGTSMSTPHVAGLVALMYTKNPFISVQEVRDLLRDNAVDLGAEGFDIFFGYGRIDAAATMDAVPEATLAIGFPEGLPNVVAPDETATFQVQINEQLETVMPGTEMLLERTAGQDEFTAYELTPLGGGLYEALLPAKACGPGSEYFISVETNEGSIVTSPADAPTSLHATLIGVLEVAMLDTFEEDLGWTVDNLGATTGDWERGVPVNDPLWDYDPETDGDGSGSAFLTQNVIGNSDVDQGGVRLTSPAIEMGSGDVFISYDYYLYLTDNEDGADALLVEVDGGDGWMPVISHATSGGLEWQAHTIDLTSAGVSVGDSVRVRFTANDDGEQNIVEAGIDHVEVSQVACGACYADFNGDGELSILDFVAFQTAFSAGDESADCNDDGSLSVLDFVCFQGAFVVGCD